MKQIIALITIIGMSLTMEAHPVVQRTKSCGGWFGYSYVHSELVAHEGSGTGYGWVIECTGRGFSSCPKKGRGAKLNDSENATVADIYDHAVAEDLINDVDLKIEAGSKGGSYQVVRQIQGQTFKRVYTVWWEKKEAKCGLEEDPEESTVKVDVEYVRV